MPDQAAKKPTTIRRCARCGEVMPIRHNCAKAREARAYLEAAKRANSDESARRLIDAAYAMVEAAEALHV